jgi:hypothetical protein
MEHFMATEAPTAGPLAAAGTASRRGPRKTLANALIITRREVRDSFRDWRIVAPIIILTFFFPLPSAMLSEIDYAARSS